MPPFDPDTEQLRILEHARGPMRVRGGAGTGKTSALRWRFRRLVTEGDPERVVLVLRSRRERDEARRVLQQDLRMPLPSLRVVTMQGLARVVIAERLGVEAPKILTADPHFARVAELLAAEDPARWGAYGPLLGMRGFTDAVREFLLRAQEAMLDPADVRRLAAARGLTGWDELATFYDTYLNDMAMAGQTDFAGLVRLASGVAAEGAPVVDHLLVDDLQDSTEGGVALVRGLATTSTVVAGNEDAHVFSFQGTTVEPFRRFVEDLPGTTEVVLATPWRGAERTVRAWHAPHGADEHAAIARELRRVHVEDGVAWRDLAVVVRRQGTNLAGIVRALDDARVPHHVPEGGIAFATESATWPYMLALRWIARPDLRDDLVEELLTSRLGGVSPASARMLMRAAVRAGSTVGAATEHREGLAADEAAALDVLTATLAEAAASSANVADAFAALWRGLPLSRRSVDAQEGNGLDAILALADAVNEAADSPDPSVEAFIAGLDARGDAPDLARLRDSGADAVQVLTAHAAAGREFDTLVIAGAVEGEFPSLARPEPMFDLAVLRRARTGTERNAERLADERRLFDHVVARARRAVLLTATEADPDGSTRSRFAGAVAWTPAPDPAEDDPVSVTDAVGRWRGALADGAAPPADRLLALDGLLAVGERPDRWWLLHDWTEPDEPYLGPTTMSFTRMRPMLACELQYLLGQELGLGGGGNAATWVGSLVHDILEGCERGAIPRNLDALRAEVERRWDASQFPSRAIKEAQFLLTRDRMMTNWWLTYGARPALAVEEDFSFDVDGVTFTGRIDRIDAVDPDDPTAGTIVSDYKTGSVKGGKRDGAPEAEHALQLRLYSLAVHRDERLARFRPVREIAVIFPRGDAPEAGVARRTLAVPEEGLEEHLAEIEGLLREQVARIRALAASGQAQATPSDAACRYCEFRGLCPAFQGRASVPVATGGRG